MGRDVPVMSGPGILLAGLLAVGCSWRGPAPLQTPRGVESTSSVMAMDKAAWKLVALNQVQADREDDGRLRVVLELANLSSKELAVQVQTVFRDKDGRLYDDETNWQMVVLPGSANYRYEVVSLRPAADSFLVQLKAP